MDYVKAFLIGGIICALAQTLMDKTKMMLGCVMVILVITGAILGAIGIYEPFAKWAGASAIVPLLGFDSTLWKGVKEGLWQDDFLDAFKDGFTSNVVEISGALIFRYPGSLISRPGMRD